MNDYEELIGLQYGKELQEAMLYYSQLPFGRELKEHELLLIAAATERCRVGKNTMVCKQDEVSDYIYFIKSG